MKIRLKDPFDVCVEQHFNAMLRKMGKGYLITPARKNATRRHIRALLSGEKKLGEPYSFDTKKTPPR